MRRAQGGFCFFATASGEQVASRFDTCIAKSPSPLWQIANFVFGPVDEGRVLCPALGRWPLWHHYCSRRRPPDHCSH